MPATARIPALRRLRWLTLLGSGLLGACQATLFSGLNLDSSAQGVREQRDVIYEPTERLALDIYRPAQSRDAPVVVFFYGGSWKSGKRQWYRWAGQALARQGLIVIVPDYRQWPKVRLAGFMHDAARAVAWGHAHARELGGDPARVYVMGHSAGAHIGALLVTDPSYLADVGMRPRQLAGFIGLAGPYDFLPLTNPDFVDMFGSTLAEQQRSQPIHFVSGDEPPMLLLQGGGDRVVQPRNAQSLADTLRAHGDRATLIVYPDIGHAAILLALSGPFRGKAPVLADSMTFIRGH